LSFRSGFRSGSRGAQSRLTRRAMRPMDDLTSYSDCSLNILLLFLSILLCLHSSVCAEEKGNFSQLGMASWYGNGFSRTASGERYDPAAFTAAHRTLPFGTIVRVTNLSNKLSTTVRINNRGPFKKGRIIDLSQSAATQIQMIRSGTARVEVVRLSEL